MLKGIQHHENQTGVCGEKKQAIVNLSIGCPEKETGLLSNILYVELALLITTYPAAGLCAKRDTPLMSRFAHYQAAAHALQRCVTEVQREGWACPRISYCMFEWFNLIEKTVHSHFRHNVVI